MTMRVCSWCWLDLQTGRRLTEQEYKETTKPNSNVSHGICPKCLNKKATEIESANCDQALGKLTERHK